MTITTIYNRQSYLAATIESILAQTHRNFEYVLWDDGSTDASLAIARHYALKDDLHVHNGWAGQDDDRPERAHH